MRYLYDKTEKIILEFDSEIFEHPYLSTGNRVISARKGEAVGPLHPGHYPVPLLWYLLWQQPQSDFHQIQPADPLLSVSVLLYSFFCFRSFLPRNCFFHFHSSSFQRMSVVFLHVTVRNTTCADWPISVPVSADVPAAVQNGLMIFSLFLH